MHNFDSQEVVSNNVVATNTVGFRHRPVFIVQNFDQSNIENIKGYMTLKMNRTMAIEIIKLIESVELEETEAHLHAFKCQLSNWHNIRKDVLARLMHDTSDFASENSTENDYNDDTQMS